jgi:hypothetical protein
VAPYFRRDGGGGFFCPNLFIFRAAAVGYFEKMEKFPANWYILTVLRMKSCYNSIERPQ